MNGAGRRRGDPDRYSEIFEMPQSGWESPPLACDDKDRTSVGGPGGSAGAGTAGSGGNAGGGNGGTSAGGNAGNGGSAGADLDGGIDATADADAASVGGACVLSTIEEYCAALACPALADARDEFRNSTTPYLRAIVQRPCVAPNGDARIAVTGHFGAWTRTYIYDAATEELVGVEFIDDLGGCSPPANPSDTGLGSWGGFYGEAAPDCSSGGLPIELPAGCVDAGAALEDWEPDAGPPYECVLAP